MKVRVAYIEEPPFYWTNAAGAVTGSDIELADVVLRAIGVTSIEYQPTSFEELLPGVQENRWDMNVPIFVTSGRAAHVAFSVPVWALGDGFVVHAGNPKALTGYAVLAQHGDARIGLINGQVQIDSAKSAGVRDEQITMFKDQPEAIAALLAGKIDAFAGTAVGNRAIAGSNKELEAVAHDMSKETAVPVGAFSFNKSNHALLQAVNEQLRQYLGSADHRARMAKFGLTDAEIDSVAAVKR
ncbi:transporter substrate-binding domain-containing protein [Burkholderia sp. Ac-20365]|uniref:transporter substrate-binding domain-containing protein n=1 Tax=Burkholderia sp. Ac-20365 TaxID=2703897 RepID=UPI00197BDB1A|nr:transporter substrate-binding domain-containing protein [Burkholderia sp. Ac-20365]MBN3763543.1 transporter substrate-binding domain-containing protein [Burkholderia sp. Ac-20365]